MIKRKNILSIKNVQYWHVDNLYEQAMSQKLLLRGSTWVALNWNISI